MKRKLLLGVVVSAIFLFLAVRGIDWSQFARELKRTQYAYLIPGVFFTLLGHFSRAVRWRFI